jgi:hypothetical protein
MTEKEIISIPNISNYYMEIKDDMLILTLKKYIYQMMN